MNGFNWNRAGSETLMEITKICFNLTKKRDWKVEYVLPHILRVFSMNKNKMENETKNSNFYLNLLSKKHSLSEMFIQQIPFPT